MCKPTRNFAKNLNLGKLVLPHPASMVNHLVNPIRKALVTSLGHVLCETCVLCGYRKVQSQKGNW